MPHPPSNTKYMGERKDGTEPAIVQPEAADETFMREALRLAERAGEDEEVPVGAVVVYRGVVVGEGWNRPVQARDPTSHAETEALRQAAAVVGNYRLPGATLYVTLEPCVMCVGALVIARVERLVFGARDLRFGAVRSKFALADSPLLNHQVSVTEGVLAVAAAEQLTRFFSRKRN